MAETSKLKNPRRKKGAKFHPKDAPFPVPVENITKKECCDSRWFYYTGYFRDNCVVIENHGDLTFLYKMGFFGKGNLSRSKPEYEVISNISQKAFSNSERLRRLPPKERQIRQSKFREIRKERFKNHKEWYRLSNDIGAAEPVQTSRDLAVNEEKEGEESSERKRRKEELEDSSSTDMKKDKADLEMVEESEEEEEGLEKDDTSAENNKNNRDVDEVMQDVLRQHNKEESTKEDPLSSQDLTPKQKTKSSRKQDPYKVFEHLQLSLEEAFFLSYGLGCLAVYDDEKKPITISEMWRRFCKAKQDFIPCYVVYHYFRAKGWVPKTGIKYGTDFVLYKQGMPFYHSSYSIIVQVAEKDSLAPSSNSTVFGQCTLVSWCSLGGPNRVSEHAAKEVMICYVIIPAGPLPKQLFSSNMNPGLQQQQLQEQKKIGREERASHRQNHRHYSWLAFGQKVSLRLTLFKRQHLQAKKASQTLKRLQIILVK